MRSEPHQRLHAAAGIGLVLVLLLAWPAARRALARATAPRPAAEARLPDGAGARLHEAMRQQALIRAERTVDMLRSLEAERPEVRR